MGNEELLENLLALGVKIFESKINENGISVVFKVRAKPGSKMETLKVVEGELVIGFKEKPIEGAANKALIKKIGKLFGVSSKNVFLIRGEKSKTKELKTFFVFEGRKNLEYYLSKLKEFKSS